MSLPICPTHGTLLLRTNSTGDMRCIDCRDPWEALARERKVSRIVDALERCCPMTGEEAEQLDESGRRAAALLARVRPASPTTWALVVDRLREHEAAAARREAG